MRGALTPAIMRIVVLQRGHLGLFLNDRSRQIEPAMHPHVRMMGCLLYFSRSAFLFRGQHGSTETFVSVLPIWSNKEKMGWGSLTQRGRQRGLDIPRVSRILCRIAGWGGGLRLGWSGDVVEDWPCL